MPDAPAKVRDACDRCHSKKMRCERTGATCERCQQAGATCTFSPRTPYNASNRLRSGAHRSRRSSLGLRKSSANQAEAAESSIHTPRSLEAWSINDVDLAQINCVGASSTTPISPQFCPPPTSTDLNDAWMNIGAFNLDFAMPATPTFLQTSNSLLSPESPVNPESQGQNEGSDKYHNQTHSVADISTKIFQTPGPGHTSDQSMPTGPSSEQSLPHAEFYCQTFASSHTLVQALTSYGDAPSASSFNSSNLPTAEIDDAEFLLVLASYLKLLGRYDTIFGYWLPLVEAEMQGSFDQIRSSTLRDTILHVLPPTNVASLLAPTCYVAQIRLVLEISHKMYQRLSQSLENVAERITGRANPGAAGSVGHISNTTLELIMGRERMVRAKKNKLVALMENPRLRESMERHFVMLQGGDSL